MSYSAEVLIDTPLVYWRLGEPSGTVVSDASGNANDGTYSGTPTLATVGLLAADADTAVRVNGDPDKAQSPASFGPTTFTAGCAVEVLAKVTDFPPVFLVLAGMRKVTGDQFALILTDTTVVGETTGSPSGVGYAPALGVTHHYVARYDGADVILYVDGVEVERQASGSVPEILVSTPFVAGQDPNADGSVDVTIDEAAFYDHDLSAARIAAHYAASVVNAPITEGPTVRLVTSRALAVPHQVQRWVLPIICKRFANIGPDDQIEAQQDVAAVREFFLGLRRSGTPVAFQEGTSRHLVVVRDVSFPDGMVEQWGNQRDGMEGLLMVTVDSTEDV